VFEDREPLPLPALRETFFLVARFADLLPFDLAIVASLFS
jgi:hypothetical protein